MTHRKVVASLLEISGAEVHSPTSSRPSCSSTTPRAHGKVVAPLLESIRSESPQAAQADVGRGGRGPQTSLVFGLALVLVAISIFALEGLLRQVLPVHEQQPVQYEPGVEDELVDRASDWATDPLYGQAVRKDGFRGRVTDVEVGRMTGERLYLIQYADGDVEHFLADEVRAYLAG